VEHCGRGHAAAERGVVYEWLEGRARLAQRLGRTVELGVVEVASADQRPDFTRCRIHGDEQTLKIGGLAVLTAIRILHHGRVRWSAISLRPLDARPPAVHDGLGMALHLQVER